MSRASRATVEEPAWSNPSLREPRYSQSLERGLAILGCFTPQRLEELRQRTSYTVNLSVLDGSDILYVDRARSFRRGQSKIDLGLHPGSRLPAYCTSMGKLLMAYLPEPEQKDLFSEIKLTKRGPNTITSKKALRNELDEVADAGFAVNDEELAPELHSISAPVRNESREVVAAVNMAAHSSMISLKELVDALGPHLVSTADRISARLGYRRDDEVIAGVGR
jgi:IclR family transcriptional regulator, pca regulon regulatory protein